MKIMADIRRIYTDKTIDHAMRPRNLSHIKDADGYAKLTSPCGGFIEALNKYQAEAGEKLNLKHVIERAREFRSRAVVLENTIGGTMSDYTEAGSEERKKRKSLIEAINRCLKKRVKPRKRKSK